MARSPRVRPWATKFWGDNKVGGSCVTGGGWVRLGENTTLGSAPCDTSGAGEELERCYAANCRTTSVHATVGGATPNVVLARAVNVRRFSTGRIPAEGVLGPGKILVEVPSISVANGGTLTLAGGPGTQQVIVHVLGRLRFGRPSTLALEDLTAEQVLFVVEGSAGLHSFTTFEGSLYAKGNAKIGFSSILNGTVVSERRLVVGNFAKIQHRPFVGW